MEQALTKLHLSSNMLSDKYILKRMKLKKSLQQYILEKAHTISLLAVAWKVHSL
jgi:hypothetical protein